MDLIEESIMMSLMEQDGIGFEELITNVKNRTGKSRQTVSTRLKKMIEKKFVGKRKHKYYLDLDSDAKESDREYSNEVTKLRKRTNKVIKSTNFLEKGPPLIHEIFYNWYVPMINNKIVFGPMFSAGQNYKLEYELKKCEKMIQELSARFGEEIRKKNLSK